MGSKRFGFRLKSNSNIDLRPTARFPILATSMSCTVSTMAGGGLRCRCGDPDSPAGRSDGDPPCVRHVAYWCADCPASESCSSLSPIGYTVWNRRCIENRDNRTYWYASYLLSSARMSSGLISDMVSSPMSGSPRQSPAYPPPSRWPASCDVPLKASTGKRIDRSYASERTCKLWRCNKHRKPHSGSQTENGERNGNGNGNGNGTQR